MEQVHIVPASHTNASTAACYTGWQLLPAAVVCKAAMRAVMHLHSEHL